MRGFKLFPSREITFYFYKLISHYKAKGELENGGFRVERNKGIR